MVTKRVKEISFLILVRFVNWTNENWEGLNYWLLQGRTGILVMTTYHLSRTLIADNRKLPELSFPYEKRITSFICFRLFNGIRSGEGP